MNKVGHYFYITPLVSLLFFSLWIAVSCSPDFKTDSNRTIRNATFTRMPLEQAIVDSVSTFARIYTDNTDIYVINNVRKQIDRYSARGEYLNAIGDGEGHEPGKFDIIGNMLVKDDTVWVVDRTLIRVSAFHKEGHFLQSFDLHGDPDDLARIGDLLYTEIAYHENRFCAYSSSTEIEVFSFGNLTENDAEYASSLDGQLLTYDDSMLIFAPRLSSTIFRYTIDGSALPPVMLPDQQHFPKTIILPSNAWATPAAAATYFAHNLSNDTLYTFTRIGAVNETGRENIPPYHRYIDVTSVHDGYLFSVHADSAQLPIRNVMGFTPGHIIGMGYDNTVQSWKIDF